MINVLKHPLAKHYLHLLRDERTSELHFRSVVKKIGLLLAAEVYADLETIETQVETPMETVASEKLKSNVILVPVLRAGLGLLEPFLELLPTAKVGFSGMSRNDDTLQPEEYHFSCPPSDENSLTVVLDIMLATGGSAAATLSRLELLNPGGKIGLATVISAPEGLEAIRSKFPEVKILTADVDRELNANGYILPGLGDAGDRLYGTEPTSTV